ncbi:MAG: lamin tail domain-containing protein [Oscillospiraceae bacterium]|jgi:hypothetical protein|nr:lamin tail domain-containing protein [Oscillospiraceae bacterium]
MLSKGKKFILYVLLIVVGAGALFLSVRELAKKPVLIISEVCSANRGIMLDADGEYSDFIEIYNAGEIRASLKGYYLSDNDNKPLRWRFPSSVTLEPGEYLYVFASSKNKIQGDGVLHTNFSISQLGEPIILSNPQGVSVSRAEPFESVDNISLAYIDETVGFAYLGIPTPGAPNTGAYALDPSELGGAQTVLKISEYMSKNTGVFPDADGMLYDWAELFNPNDVPVSLVGWSLTDNADNPDKWSFPGGYSIGPGEYLTVYMSGLEKPGHASFRLGDQDEGLFLIDPTGQTVDEIEVYDTPLDVSYGRAADGAEGFFAAPTPGAPNKGSPAPDMASIEWDAPSVMITEYMSSNSYYVPDAEGEYNDWLELYNYGAETVNLAGFTLSDTESSPDKWTFPDGTFIAAGGRLVIQLSGKNLPGHADFSLGGDDDCVFLGDRYGRAIDIVPLVLPNAHVSYGRDESSPENWLYFPIPTPGEPNSSGGFSAPEGVSALSWRGAYISRVDHLGKVSISNDTESAISLVGWHLSDSQRELARFALPEKEIAPGGTLEFQTALKLESGGETLYLTDGAGALRDVMSTGTLKLGVTSGRLGQTDKRMYFDGAGNAYSGFAGQVRASVDDGYVSAGTQVALSSEGGTVRFTLDGTEPSASSQIYSSPVTINANTTLRARAFVDGLLPGAVLTRTYLTGARHTLPVVNISTDPDNLFDYNTGLFEMGPGASSEFPYKGANFWKDWEKPIHFSYYDENGRLCVEADAGIKTFGQYSRAEAQKGLAIHFRKDYGVNRISYPFFAGNGVTEYASLVLRASGQDWKYTKMRDAYMTNVVKDEMNLDFMDTLSVVVYINGEYWGLYDLREKINENYFEIKYGVEEDDIDIIKGNSQVLAGSMTEYNAFVKELESMNMNTDAAYDYIVSHMDLENWMDFWIAETFYVNTDSGNIKFWKQKGEDGRWRWVLFDLDWGLFPSTFRDYPVSRMIDPKGHGVGKMFSTKIARAVLKNTRVREEFVARYNHHLDTTFAPERMLAIFDSMTEHIRPEMQRQIERFPDVEGGIASMAGWERTVGRLREIIQERHGMVREELVAINNYR